MRSLLPEDPGGRGSPLPPDANLSQLRKLLAEVCALGLHWAQVLPRAVGVAGSLASLQSGFEMGWEREEVSSVMDILS